MTDIVAVVADTHINSTVGLCAPGARLDDGGEYKLSKGQRWLWDNWLDYWGHVKKIKGKKTFILVGDAIESNGTRGFSAQYITSNAATINEIAVKTLEPALDVVDQTFVLRGTSVHVQPSASMEERLGKDIGAVKTDEGNYSWWELLAEFGGVIFFAAHHSSMGRLPWTYSNALNVVAIRIMIEHEKGNFIMPNVAIFAHNHRFAETGLNYPVRIVKTPGWQLKTEYVNRLGLFEAADIGGLIFHCKDKKYEMELKPYKPELPKVWR